MDTYLRDTQTLLTLSYTSLLRHFAAGGLVMELLSFDTTCAVIICTRCQHALIPSGIAAHLKTTHSVSRGRLVQVF